jgi:hypothetical protein
LLKEKCKKDVLSKDVQDMVDLLYMTAIEMNLSGIDHETDIEFEARLGDVSKILIEKKISHYFKAFAKLPYAATENITSMLEYLSQYPLAYESRWKARQLKMGLFLHNPYARLTWFRLFSSLLYTYECQVKFRKPVDTEHNIYHLDYPSFARGPTDEEAEHAN